MREYRATSAARARQGATRDLRSRHATIALSQHRVGRSPSTKVFELKGGWVGWNFFFSFFLFLEFYSLDYMVRCYSVLTIIFPLTTRKQLLLTRVIFSTLFLKLHNIKKTQNHAMSPYKKIARTFFWQGKRSRRQQQPREQRCRRRLIECGRTGTAFFHSEWREDQNGEASIVSSSGEIRTDWKRMCLWTYGRRHTFAHKRTQADGVTNGSFHDCI